MMRWRAVVAATVACGSLALGGVLAGCGSSSGGSDSAAQSITLYSGQHEQTTDGLVTAFEKQTGITVNVRNDDEDQLADLIAVQGSHSPADVIYTENSPALEFLQNKGLLAAVDPSTLARVAAKYSSPAGDWVGVSARVSVIIYNPSLIAKSQLPAARQPEVQGQARLCRRGDRLPADRHLGGQELRPGRGGDLAERHQVERREPYRSGQ